MIYVTDASYVGDYKIHLRFSDSREGVVDLQEVIVGDHRQVFRELQDMKRFQDFHVEMDTIVWGNGLDLAPEFLWERVV
jgi:hypothetical protein